MSKLNIVRRCYNCGAVLQCTDKRKTGYVDKEIFEKDSVVLLCKHCWDAQTFNIAPREANVDKDYLTMLQDARASDAMIVYMVDLFSFESSFVSKVTSTLRGLNMLVIANKRDLLPDSYPDEKLKEYVAHRFRVARLNVQAKDVELTSLTSFSDISSIIKRVLDQRKRHDVYIVGALNSGKTLFVNNFLKNYSNSTQRAVSTTYYPQTTMRVLQIPLDSSSTIFDSPGLSIDNSMIDKVDIDTVKKIIPTEAVEKRSFTLNKGESLFFGGLARIDLIEGDKEQINAFAAADVSIKSSKNPDSTFVEGLSKGSLKPISKGISSLSDFDAFEIVIDEKGSRDIGIEGLGWISFTGNNQTFRVFVPKGVSIYTTRAKLDYGTQINIKR